MNSVHEPCPNNDSEIVLSPKTRSKLSQVHSAPNLAQPARTGESRPRARGRVVVTAADRVVGIMAVSRALDVVSWPCAVRRHGRVVAVS